MKFILYFVPEHISWNQVSHSAQRPMTPNVFSSENVLWHKGLHYPRRQCYHHKEYHSHHQNHLKFHIWFFVWWFFPRLSKSFESELVFCWGLLLSLRFFKSRYLLWGVIVIWAAEPLRVDLDGWMTTLMILRLTADCWTLVFVEDWSAGVSSVAEVKLRLAKNSSGPNTFGLYGRSPIFIKPFRVVFVTAICS